MAAFNSPVGPSMIAPMLMIPYRLTHFSWLYCYLLFQWHSFHQINKKIFVFAKNDDCNWLREQNLQKKKDNGLQDCWKKNCKIWMVFVAPFARLNKILSWIFIPKIFFTWQGFVTIYWNGSWPHWSSKKHKIFLEM